MTKKWSKGIKSRILQGSKKTWLEKIHTYLVYMKWQNGHKTKQKIFAPRPRYRRFWGN